MDRKFTLSCCSTVDLPYSYMESRDIPVLFYTYVVDGREYDDDMGRDPEALPRFYGFLKEGKLPQTSQINVAAYTEFFEKLLDKGGDVLHIAFTSGQSGSVHNAFLAAEELKDRYPGQRLVVIDSLCSSSGYGLLVDYAADMRDEGKTLDEVAQWVLDNRNKVHHQFFSSDMTQFRRTGRVSGAAAAKTINIVHSDSYKTTFSYNRWEHLYKMSMYSRAAGAFENTVDELTGKQLGFTNLLVCFAGIADYPGNSGGVQQVDYVSGGEAYFFTRGAVQRGTWQKASPEHPLKVYAADGSELCFNRGKTYLAIVDDDEWPNFNYQ